MEELVKNAKDFGFGGGKLWMISNLPGATVFRKDAFRWTEVKFSGAERITVDDNGLPYVVNSIGAIFKYSGNSWKHLN